MEPQTRTGLASLAELHIHTHTNTHTHPTHKPQGLLHSLLQNFLPVRPLRAPEIDQVSLPPFWVGLTTLGPGPYKVLTLCPGSHLPNLFESGGNNGVGPAQGDQTGDCRNSGRAHLLPCDPSLGHHLAVLPNRWQQWASEVGFPGQGTKYVTEQGWNAVRKTKQHSEILVDQRFI